MKKSAQVLCWIGNRIGKPPGWERVVRMIVPPEKCRSMQEVCIAKDGIAFIAQPSVPLGWHITFFGSYEPELREILRAVLPIGGVALDIGANVGWHTLLMAKLVGQTGKVLAAEANPSVRERLENNLTLNRFRQVTVLPYAMTDKEGTVDFYGPQENDSESGNGYVVTTAVGGATDVIRVETRRIDSIILTEKIERLDLIKIDVEGYEWPVLLGAEQSIADYRPHIVFEYNAEYSWRGGGTPTILESFFQKHSYRLFAITRAYPEAIVGNNWPNCADIWAVPVIQSKTDL